MSITLLGKKLGMTQVYSETGEMIPVTVIEAGPCPVIQVKTSGKDGYNSIQIGFGAKKEKNTSKALLGHFRTASSKPLRKLREIRLSETPDAEPGQVLSADLFKDVSKVDVIGETKGRGFQGVVKRWNFAGGPASHGSMFHRRGGSYGMCQWPGEVVKGKKMPGHFGTERRTVQNLEVVKVLPEKNLILVKGSVPGSTGSAVVVRKAIKTRASA